MKNSKKPAIINARFTSICEETNRGIRKGESMLYDYETKKCYCRFSTKYIAFETADLVENDSTAAMIEAHENAYVDNRWAAMN